MHRWDAGIASPGRGTGSNVHWLRPRKRQANVEGGKAFIALCALYQDWSEIAKAVLGRCNVLTMF